MSFSRAGRQMVMGVMAVALIAGVNVKTFAAENLLNKIKERGTLLVGLEGTYPPFSFQDEKGKLTGFEVEFAEQLAQHMGVKASLKPTKWDGMLASLDAKRIDVVINQVTISDERKKKYDFSTPYTVSGIQALTMKANASTITKPADLAGKKVGVGLGTNYEQWLRENVKGVDIRTYDDDPTKYQDLRSGRLNAILVDRLAALDLVKKTGDTMAVAGDAFSRQESGVAMRKGNDDLLKAVNQAIADMQKDGSLSKLSEMVWRGCDEIMQESLQLVLDSAPFLLKGALFTLQLSIGGMFFGLLLGFILALMRLSRFWPVRWLARIYVSIFRGTPLIAQLFMIYYGLPQFGIELDPIPSAMIGLSLNTAAYASESLRGAISSIERGQWEAAASIGMTRWQTLRRVILPQAARTALPPLGNSFISLVKDTSLAATIQVPELFRQAQLITSRTLEVFTMYLAASLIYWVMATVLSALQNRLEQHVNRQDSESK